MARLLAFGPSFERMKFKMCMKREVHVDSIVAGSNYQINLN